jgi:hypothetical protein
MEKTSTKGNIRHGKLKSQKELKKITDSEEYKDADYESKNKMLNRATAAKGGRMSFRGGGACIRGMNKNAYGKNS